MGLTKDFFTKPIVVNVTFRATIETDGVVETIEYPVVLKMNRETVGRRNGIAVAASLFSEGDNLERFCNQLATEPQGIDDFPQDKRPLGVRAREYFADGQYQELIQYVVMEVEKAQRPIEFFRGF